MANERLISWKGSEGCTVVFMSKLFSKDIKSFYCDDISVSAEEVCLLEVSRDDGSTSPFPVVCCRNIFILPGVPHLLHRKWKVLPSLLQAKL